MGMGSNTADSFADKGPQHIRGVNEIDWAKEEHRRCIAACLVKGVYVHKNDRAKRRAVKLAPAWWESFGFRLRDEIKDMKYTRSIYGAIFEHTASHPCTPRYVVAFRGTRRSIRDYYYDLQIVMNKLQKRTRCVRACATINGLVREGGQGSCIWLAGHSLGAAVAVVVGRYMMEREKPLNLPAFLFNPPYVAFITSINLLNLDPVARRDLYFTSNLLKGVAGMFLVSHRKRRENLFQRLSAWVPNLYVHERDWICQGFIGYFEEREEFKESFTRAGIWFMDHFGGREEFKKIFTRVGIWSMVLSHRDLLSWALLGKEKEQPHLLPSATLSKSRLQPEYAQHLSQWQRRSQRIAIGFS